MKKKKAPLLPLLKLVRRCRYLYFGAGFATALNVLLGFVTPALLAELFDHYLGALPSRLPPWLDGTLGAVVEKTGGFWAFGLMILLVNALKGFFSYLKGIWCAKASENNAKYLRDKLFRHLLSLSYDEHVKASTGDLLQRCTSDVDTVRRFLNVQLMSIFNCALMVGVALALMLPISSKITLVSMIPVPFLLLFSMKFFTVVIAAYDRVEEAEGKMSAALQENLTGIRVVRAFGHQKSEIDKFDQTNGAHFKEGLKAAPLDALYWTSGDLFNVVQGLLILCLCILESHRGHISTGDMVILLTYSGMLMDPTRRLGRILSDAGRSLVALGRITDVLLLPPEPAEPEAVRPSLRGDIVFRDVSFSYPGGGDVLRHIDMRIPGGKTVGLLGATGSGKSTLVHLLQRLYEPSEGFITIGSTPLSSIDREYLRRRIGLVLQETFLYSRSIRENVCIAAPDTEEDKLLSAVRDASAYDFITKSERGFDTMVGERGVTLSGGQKQRIAIARTLLKENDILIFDDSLSAVDTETDAAIRKALEKRKSGITTIIISHRISTLKQADLIYVMEDGRVTEQGTHESLIKRGGIYASIDAIQSGAMDKD